MTPDYSDATMYATREAEQTDRVRDDVVTRHISNRAGLPHGRTLYCGMRFVRLLFCASALFSAHCSHNGIPCVAMNQPDSVSMPKGFTYVDTLIPTLRTNLKYAGSDNFVGRPLNGYRGRRAILRAEAAEALKNAAADLARQGYGIVIYDAYRPHTAMQDITAWGRDAADRKMKARYYPNIDKERVFGDAYVHNFSEHSRGVAVDLSLYHLNGGRPVDMGGWHDLLDPSSATDSCLVTAVQRRRRTVLKKAMESHGFKNYAPEWWHYRLDPEPDATAHFYFPIWDGMADAPKAGTQP